jgi:hypothetical protein
MGDQTPIVREHKKLGDELDDIYIEAVNASAFARGYLVHKKGNPNELFFQFYYPFSALFQHTRFLPELKNADEQLIKDIDAWIAIEQRPTRSIMRKGLELFSDYQKILLQQGAIAVKRV